MLTYKQSTGELFQDGALLGVGYAGMPPTGKNNPAAQEIHDIGPIPQGLYTLATPDNDPKLGAFAIPLLPDAGNQMFDRAGFYMHGDSFAHPGRASEGCIVMAGPIREKAWADKTRRIEVIA